MDYTDENNEELESSDYESPIFIFPDEQEDSDDKPSSGSVKSSDGEADNSDTPRLTFGHVEAVKKEKEFVYMPFLDIDENAEDEDDGEASTLSFSKVKAVKKESEFVFMPFLNISDEPEEVNAQEEHRHHIRPDGTVFDEGLILMPLSPLEDDEPESVQEYAENKEDAGADDDDIGIYVMDAAGPGDFKAPVRTPPKSKPHNSAKNSSAPNSKSSKGGKGSKGGKKKRPPAGYNQPKGGSYSVASNMPTAEEQFRTAMMNINPEIKRAAMRDPIQRAALEQAVRIALVQQAAQEAVAKTTGNPGGYAGFMLQNSPQGSGKKKGHGHSQSGPSYNMNQAMPQTQHQQSVPSVRGFQLAGFNSVPAEFGAVSQSPAQQSPNAADAHIDFPGNSNESIDFASTISTQSAPAPAAVNPDVMQDPVLASLSPTGSTAPNMQQDPALASLSRSSGTKSISYTSPAAIRAAMRSGVDVSSLSKNSAASPADSAASQKQKLQEAVDTQKSGCLIWIIVLFIAFFIGLIAFFVAPLLSSQVTAQKAATMFSNGQYLDAYEAYRDIGEIDKANESLYKYASQLETDGKYEEAIKQFSKVTTYPVGEVSPGERVAECRYALAKQYMDDKDYAAAYDQLKNIGGYKDAGDLAMQSNYLCAMQLYDAGDYKSAMSRFGMYKDYEASFAYWQVSQYNFAVSELAGNNYQSALTLFEELQDYGDSPYMAAMSRYYVMTSGIRYPVNVAAETLQILADGHGTDDISEILGSMVFAQAKLTGIWVSTDSKMAIVYLWDGQTGATTELSWCFADGVVHQSSADAYFDNGNLYNSAGDELPAFRIDAFTPADSAQPDSVEVYCYADESRYTLYRS